MTSLLITNVRPYGEGEPVNVLVENGVIASVNAGADAQADSTLCLLYTSPSPRDRTRSRMPSSA